MKIESFYKGKKKPPPIPTGDPTCQWLKAIHTQVYMISQWVVLMGVITLVLVLVGGCMCVDRFMSTPQSQVQRK